MPWPDAGPLNQPRTTHFLPVIADTYVVLSDSGKRLFWVGPSPCRHGPAPSHRLANRVRTPLRDGPAEPGRPQNSRVIACRFCIRLATERPRESFPEAALVVRGSAGNAALALGPHCETCAAALALSHANHLPSVRKSGRRRPRHVAVSPVLFTHLQVGRPAQLDERSLSHPASHHRRRPRSRDLDVELNAPPGHSPSSPALPRPLPFPSTGPRCPFRVVYA